MADYSGIEAVTSTVRQILLQRSREPPAVTVAPPDLDVPETDPPVVNLFLYQVSENATLRNAQLPPSAGAGALGPPPLSLDLRYLLTATGTSRTDDRGAHRVLGDAMLTLHDHPVVAKDDPLLDPALRDEVELLKITLESLDTDELSKIWSATTAPYRLGVGYRVTVVQLESTRPPRVVRAVGEPPEAGPRVHVVPLERPVVNRVGVLRRGPDGTDGAEQPVAYARIGEALVLRGHRLLPGTRVLLDDVDATGGVTAGSTADRLIVRIPDDAALSAGVHRVQVARDVTIGDARSARTVPLLRSGLAAFVLVPSVTGLEPGAGTSGTTLNIAGERLRGGSTMVLVGPQVLTPQEGMTETELSVTVTGLQPGIHPVSVRVDGVDSIDAVFFEVTP